MFSLFSLSLFHVLYFYLCVFVCVCVFFYFRFQFLWKCFSNTKYFLKNHFSLGATIHRKNSLWRYIEFNFLQKFIFKNSWKMQFISKNQSSFLLFFVCCLHFLNVFKMHLDFSEQLPFVFQKKKRNQQKSWKYLHLFMDIVVSF